MLERRRLSTYSKFIRKGCVAPRDHFGSLLGDLRDEALVVEDLTWTGVCCASGEN